jgi:hypothetical protein|tara:strand:- start:205 stop:510 length:306 start_codon:yes stop_codon:yes gene_type:complete
MNKKEVGAKAILETLTEDGFFDNEWIDEHKFRPRFFNAVSKLNEDTTTFGKLFELAEAISKDIIRENIDNTMKDLIKKGIVESVNSDSDEPTYKLNVNKNE